MLLFPFRANDHIELHRIISAARCQGKSLLVPVQDVPIFHKILDAGVGGGDQDDPVAHPVQGLDAEQEHDADAYHGRGGLDLA